MAIWLERVVTYLRAIVHRINSFSVFLHFTTTEY